MMLYMLVKVFVSKRSDKQLTKLITTRSWYLLHDLGSRYWYHIYDTNLPHYIFILTFLLQHYQQNHIIK